jgi:3-mercaptopyruvate sulfurtransferase SseA
MDYWNLKAKRTLKSELVLRGISHEELAKRLNAVGIRETKSAIDSKMSRGTFSAAFFLQCLSVLGCTHLVLAKSVQLDLGGNAEV